MLKAGVDDYRAVLAASAANAQIGQVCSVCSSQTERNEWRQSLLDAYARARAMLDSAKARYEAQKASYQRAIESLEAARAAYAKSQVKPKKDDTKRQSLAQVDQSCKPDPRSVACLARGGRRPICSPQCPRTQPQVPDAVLDLAATFDPTGAGSAVLAARDCKEGNAGGCLANAAGALPLVGKIPNVGGLLVRAAEGVARVLSQVLRKQPEMVTL